jgi:tetratricopeptide (TPR) repeat protein
VLQYAGDSLLAAFGAEAAREDDAERAVHCGLALLAEGRAFARRVQTEHGHAGSDVRVGIHTGPVLLGGGVDEGDSIRGQAVNIAARMEQTAPAGTLRISHDTWMLVRGLFTVQAQAPLAVKGVAQALVTYLVEAAKPRSFRVPTRGIEGVHTPMVGRDAELAALAALLDDAASQRRMAVATIVGEPGLGKSRLLAEAQALLELHATRFWLFLGRGDPQQYLQPYGVLRELLAWRLGIADSDSGALARQRLVDGLRPWLGGQAQAKAELVGHLVGMDFDDSEHVRGLPPQTLRQRAFEALAEYLQGLSAAGDALALLIEDLHWADDGTLDFIEHLALRHAALPLWLVATARPTLLQRRPHWALRPAGHRLLQLQDLPSAAAQAMASALLVRAGPAGAELAAHIAQRSDGNPFFIEELVRMCMDLGALVDEGDHWRVVQGRLDWQRLPTTLVGVLQARLDALEPAQRRALQQASVVGVVFWDAALAALDAHAPGQMDALRQRALVHRQPHSAFDDTSEDAFHHRLLQQVTYDTVLRPMRRAGHAAAARWLAQRVGDRPAEYLAITAEHYDRAGDAEQALRYFTRAAAEARRRFANSAALAYLQRALASPGAVAGTRAALLGSLAAVTDSTGDRVLQEQACREHLMLAEQLGDAGTIVSALSDMALLQSRRGDEAGALALAQRVLTFADRTGPCESVSIAHGQMAWSLFCMGDLDGADRHAAAGLEAARVTADGRIHARLSASLRAQGLTMQLILAEARQQVERGLAIGNEILEITRLHGMRRELAQALCSRSTVLQGLGRWQDALQSLHECRQLCAENGFALTGATAAYHQATCQLDLGDRAAAAATLDPAEAAFRAIDDPAMLARALWLRGRIAAANGQHDAAAQHFETARAGFERLGQRAWVMQCVAARARLALRRGDLESAAADAQTLSAALFDTAPTSGVSDLIYPGWVCHRVWAALGDSRAAAQLQALRDALAAQAQGLTDPELRRSLLQDVPLHRRILAGTPDP